MLTRVPVPPLDDAARELVGYLNFSSGKRDPKLFVNVNRLWLETADDADPDSNRADGTRAQIVAAMERLAGSSAAFNDLQQVRSVVAAAFDQVLPAYIAHQSDLLAHLPRETFRQPFFLARVLEATLQAIDAVGLEAAPGDAVDRLGDFLGYRPIAVLENGRKTMPYEFESHAPLPVFVGQAGTHSGDYADLVAAALELLEDSPAEILIDSYFEFERLDEIAVDLRAHDHLHPVYKRTNYMFGEWDPQIIDTKGEFRRFILRRIILEALQDWVDDESLGFDRDERLFDAAAALAGTILMASTISGAGPGTHDSTVSLTSLLPVVARRRDEFYERLIAEATGPRARRLKELAEQSRQPFGHIRQHVNMTLSRYGARQVQNRELASLYARIGFPEASRAAAAELPSVSARFECELQCRIGAVHRAVEAGDVDEAARLLPELPTLLERGVRCGALVDPWNILGFAGHFPVFQAREDSIPDSRIETLLILMEGIFNAMSRVLVEAAAQDHPKRAEISERFRELAAWWDQFGAETIEDLPEVTGLESWESATHVAEVLVEWRRAGESAGDVSFWREHVDKFESAHAYAPVVEALLDRRDFVAAMGLLMQWLSQIDDVGAESARQSIFSLLQQWMQLVTSADAGKPARSDRLAKGGDGESAEPITGAERAGLLRRLFAFLEANAEDYWAVPQLDLSPGGESSTDLQSESAAGMGPGEAEDWLDQFDDDEDDGDSLFSAAYEDVTYRDSTDDGNFGDTLDDGGPGGPDGEFEVVSRRLEPRLKFLHTVGQLWQNAAVTLLVDVPQSDAVDVPQADADEAAATDDAIADWHRTSIGWQTELVSLLKAIWATDIDTIAGDQEANIEYDNQFQAKNFLLHQIIVTLVCLRNASRLLQSARRERLDESREKPGQSADRSQRFEQRLTAVYRAILQEDTDSLADELPRLLRDLEKRPLLYVPIESGGDPLQVLRIQTLQSVMRWLLREMPRRGLLRETWHLLCTAARMERVTRPNGPAITEFDRLFETALRESLDTALASAKSWSSHSPEAVATLVGEIVDHYHRRWLKHSRTMRLSAVDHLRIDGEADRLERFVKRYGGELFHASQLTLSHVRAILHHGVDWYLDYLTEFDDPLHPLQLLDDLEQGVISRDEVAQSLELIYSIIVDKYDRFLEYNTTTTQSDYGEKLYLLFDFLQLEAQYDRDEWNLTPLVIAHEAMVRADEREAAAVWQDEFARRIVDQATQYPRALAQLEREHGMRMPAIADHLGERFVKPLAVNRMLADVERCVRLRTRSDARKPPTEQADGTGESDADERQRTFDRLTREIDDYLEDMVGSGVDVPDWLQDLHDESELADARVIHTGSDEEAGVRTPRARLSRSELQAQLAVWDEPLEDE